MNELVSRLPEAARHEFDQRIQRRLSELRELESTRQVLAYLPLADEPCLVPVLRAVVAAAKRVYIPVADDVGHLRYVRWTPADEVRARPYGRWTPSSTEEPAAEASLVVVPGRAFDRRGMRLGRGKGCYDRSMDALRRFGMIVGVAYDAQVVDELPCEPHDQAVDVLVTESRTLRFARGPGDAP